MAKVKGDDLVSTYTMLTRKNKTALKKRAADEGKKLYEVINDAIKKGLQN